MLVSLDCAVSRRLQLAAIEGQCVDSLRLTRLRREQAIATSWLTLQMAVQIASHSIAP